eukprot:TRINITY_DN16113_c0_g1_i1.p1 TRINITY_DN16113_c0_g1~~TRINITY_DN16113_c0_g1_i1.p1  ORF type:complete len:1009 (+),score=127.29 TRINITY_DN16113_c0_g1_i1:32-3058(+)
MLHISIFHLMFFPPLKMAKSRSAWVLLVCQFVSTLGQYENALPDNMSFPAFRNCNEKFKWTRYFIYEPGCPAACPFMAEEDQTLCQFQCINDKMCGKEPFHPRAIIPSLGDTEGTHAYCRECGIPACRVCKLDVVESCLNCMPGYLRGDGKDECVMLGMGKVEVGMAIGGVVALLAVALLFDMYSRPIVNQTAVDHCAEIYDTACFLQRGGSHWPWWTNVMSETEIGGLGSLLHFRFQMAVLVWAVVLYLSWIIYATETYPVAIGMGFKIDPKSRVQFCQIGARGHVEFNEALPMLIKFNAFAYLFTFFGCIIYTAGNQNLIHRCDNSRDSMQDFAASLEIPIMAGRDVERILKEAVERATGQRVVGVCVAWNFVQDAELIPHLVPIDGDYPEKHVKGEDEERTGMWGSTVDGISEVILDAFGGLEEAMPEEEKPSKEDVVKLLEEMESTNWAIVLFDTEHSRDEAIAAGDKSIEINGEFYSLTEDEDKNEPESIIWANLGMDPEDVKSNERTAYFYIVGLVFLWVGLFYVPYVTYEVSFTYRNGDEPGFAGDLLFTVLVVGTQVGLFLVSAMLSEGCGFGTHGQVQLCYVHLYIFALFINLVIDMCLTAAQAYFYAAGQPSSEEQFASLKDPAEIFYQYVLQKFIAMKLYDYSYPATFLIPFLLEPFIVVLIPWYLISTIVRARKSVSIYSAEKCLCIQPYDQGRYADIMFNVMCAALGFMFVPGGIDHILSGLIISCVWIYFMDHFRVLYYAEKFNYSSPVTHQRVMILWSLPCCVLLCCFISRVNNSYLGTDSFLGLGKLCTVFAVACIVHYYLHKLLIEVVIPAAIAPPISDLADVHYDDVAQHFKGHTYFDLNPVHVLREMHLKLDNNQPRPSVLSQTGSLKARQSVLQQEPASSDKAAAPAAEELSSKEPAPAEPAEPAKEETPPPAEEEKKEPPAAEEKSEPPAAEENRQDAPAVEEHHEPPAAAAEPATDPEQSGVEKDDGPEAARPSAEGDPQSPEATH